MIVSATAAENSAARMATPTTLFIPAKNDWVRTLRIAATVQIRCGRSRLSPPPDRMSHDIVTLPLCCVIIKGDAERARFSD